MASARSRRGSRDTDATTPHPCSTRDRHAGRRPRGEARWACPLKTALSERTWSGASEQPRPWSSGLDIGYRRRGAARCLRAGARRRHPQLEGRLPRAAGCRPNRPARSVSRGLLNCNLIATRQTLLGSQSRQRSLAERIAHRFCLDMGRPARLRRKLRRAEHFTTLAADVAALAGNANSGARLAPAQLGRTGASPAASSAHARGKRSRRVAREGATGGCKYRARSRTCSGRAARGSTACGRECRSDRDCRIRHTGGHVRYGPHQRGSMARSLHRGVVYVIGPTASPASEPPPRARRLPLNSAGDAARSSRPRRGGSRSSRSTDTGRYGATCATSSARRRSSRSRQRKRGD